MYIDMMYDMMLDMMYTDMMYIDMWYTLLYSVVPSLEFLKRYDTLFLGADVGDDTDECGVGGGLINVFTIDLVVLISLLLSLWSLLSIESCLARLV